MKKFLLIVIVLVLAVGGYYFYNQGSIPSSVGVEDAQEWKTFNGFGKGSFPFSFEYPTDWQLKEVRKQIPGVNGVDPNDPGVLMAVVLAPPGADLTQEFTEYEYNVSDVIIVYGGGQHDNCAGYRERDPQTKCEVIGNWVDGFDPGTNYVVTRSVRKDVSQVYAELIKTISGPHQSI